MITKTDTHVTTQTGKSYDSALMTELVSRSFCGDQQQHHTTSWSTIWASAFTHASILKLLNVPLTKSQNSFSTLWLLWQCALVDANLRHAETLPLRSAESIALSALLLVGSLALGEPVYSHIIFSYICIHYITSISYEVTLHNQSNSQWVMSQLKGHSVECTASPMPNTKQLPAKTLAVLWGMTRPSSSNCKSCRRDMEHHHNPTLALTLT